MISTLEARYPHVVERLLQCWGSPIEFGSVFGDLVFDVRANRTGWPADAWEELQFLENLHKLAYESDAETESAAEEVPDDIKWL